MAAWTHPGHEDGALQRVVCRPAASASPGSLLELPVFGHPLLNQISGGGHRNLNLNKLSTGFLCILKFKNHCLLIYTYHKAEFKSWEEERRCLSQYFQISECWFITPLGPDFPKPKKRTKMTSIITVNKIASLQESVWPSFYSHRWQNIIVKCR